MTDSHRLVRTTIFAITGSTERDIEEKIVRMCQAAGDDSIKATEWPLLKEKPEPRPEPQMPTVVTLFDIPVPVLDPIDALVASAALGCFGIVYSLTGASAGWHIALCLLILGCWTLFGITNWIAWETRRDQEAYLQQLSEARARDAGAHNPHDLR